MLIQMKVREEHQPHVLRVSENRGPLITCRCGSRVVFTLEDWGEHMARAATLMARSRIDDQIRAVGNRRRAGIYMAGVAHGLDQAKSATL